MPKYLLTYHGEMSMEDMPTDPDAIAETMAAWGQWYGSMGDALVDGGAPLSVSSAITSGGATENPAQLTGYTIVECADMAAATTIAEGCPVIPNGHTVQISEAIDMGEMGP